MSIIFDSIFVPRRWLLIPTILICVLGPERALGHDTPDGEVELAVAAVLIDRELVVTYQIGINPNTMRERLETWEKNSPDAEAELAEAFCQAISEEIPRNFVVTLGQTRTAPTAIEVTPFAMHHKSAVITLHYQLPPSDGEVSITIEDQNFLGLLGGTKRAFKCRKNAICIASNVAPIIVRANRVAFAGLEPAERIKASKIEATVTLLTAKNPTNGSKN